jgi:predicted ATPase
VRFTHLDLKDIRCFPEANLTLGPVTILVGPNNAGKSTVLKSLAMVQEGLVSAAPSSFRRVGSERAQIVVQLADVTSVDFPRAGTWSSPTLVLTLRDEDVEAQLFATSGDSGSDVARFQSLASKNRVLAFFSSRRQFGWQETANKQTGEQITGNLSNLAQRLQHLGTRPALWNQYVRQSDEILGLHLVVVPVNNGIRPGIVVADEAEIMVDALGDGVPTIAWMVAELVMAKGKLILIEEPEHDLHPKSLRQLLDLLLTAAQRNQILLTTHSHIVVNTLGARGLVYRIRPETVEPGDTPRASVEPVDTVDQRVRLLDDLGYALADMGLYEGWILLEESSAETVLKTLIALFAPKLESVRTVSGSGVDRTEKLVDDFQRLFLFLHLDKPYQDRAWVILDGDAAGLAVMANLAKTYTEWHPQHFRTWSKAKFEDFYPADFMAQTEELSSLSGHAAREAKGVLARSVGEWIRANPDDAAGVFAEVIDLLREIESDLFS